MTNHDQTDPIIDEIRRIRQEHAASFDYDIDRIIAEFQRQERESGVPTVTRPPRPVQTVRRARSA